ncbi:unnamed protein product [Leptosia nina]|uniref:Rotatin n=1 Tax=Leptosia nina TaxID=320188 RepID=A0AAV1J8E8_9NEOP
MTLENDIQHSLDEFSFIENCLEILIDFCNESTTMERYLEPNMPPTVLERTTELEVRSQKCQEINVSPTYEFQKAPPTADLIISIADVITNITLIKSSPIQAWNERGIFRVMFRCINRDSLESDRVNGGICRALCVASTCKSVRTLLAGTKDCFHSLIDTLRPFQELNKTGLFARAQATLLLAFLLSDHSASNTLWCEMKENKSTSLLEMLLQFLESDLIDLQSAATFCLTRLAQTITRKERSKQDSCVRFLDNLKVRGMPRDPLSAGDGLRNGDCQPDYIVEEMCKVLMDLFKGHLDSKKYLVNQDENWSSLCSCLSSLLSVSPRCRQYAVHRHFPKVLILTLQAFRDKLSLHGKPADVIRNANSEPILNNLNWVLTLINSSMLDCVSCKDYLSDDIAVSLNRLWPWCMMTEQLRNAIMQLLLTFTNDCSKAWSSLCACVSGRSLAGEVCALVGREASRPRATPLLPLALKVFTHCVPHQHCRSLILKSDVLSCACKLRARGNINTSCSEAWVKLCEALSRHADGAAALLAVLSSPTLRPIPPRLLTSLAHAAHHQRLIFLQSQDLLEVLSGSLLTGDTSEIVSACRAVWALAANNHRAKLVLRSAGITTAVQSTMQRLQKSHDEASQRAFELLNYTYNVLQAT